MGRLYDDPAWRRRNSRWMIAGCMPLLNALAFFYIGSKGKKKDWHIIGTVLTVLAIATLVLSVNGHYYVREIAPYTLASSWIIGIIFSLYAKTNYLKRLEVLENRRPAEPLAMRDKAWVLRNSCWFILSFLPVVGGAGLLSIGEYVNNKTAKIIGAISLGLGVAALYLLNCFSSVMYLLFDDWCLIFPLLMYIAWCMSATAACVFRHDLIAQKARVYEQNRAQYPCLQDRRWRISTSWWFAFCLLPYCGGAGLIKAGLASKTRRWVTCGSVAMGLTLLSLVFTRLGIDVFQTYINNYYAEQIVMQLYLWIWIGCLTAGLIIYYPCMNQIAALQGGAVPDPTADLVMQEKFEKAVGGRTATDTAATAGTADVKMPVIGSEPVRQEVFERAEQSARPVSAQIDINTCTEETYCTLPGITLIDAKKAMAYRNAHGAFASMDAFVDELKVKPHFAVKIFDMAYASEKPHQNSQQKPDYSDRRKLDF